MAVLHIDKETKAVVDLRKVGHYRYAEDAGTDIWCISYAFDDEQPTTWLPGAPCPERVAAHVVSGGTLVAHNKEFERGIWHYITAPRYGWPEPDIEQWDCTMTRAMAMSLPRSLDQASWVMGQPDRKDQDGYRLMMKMCRPRVVLDARHPQYEEFRAALPRQARGLTLLPDGRIAVWWYTPKMLARLARYCENDVRAEQGLDRRLRPLSAFERRIFHLDARINDRGLMIDVPTVKKARGIVDNTRGWLTEEMDVLTLGDASPTKVKKLVEWLERAGVDTDSVAKDAIEDLLARDDLAHDVRRVLEIRNDAGKSAHSKLDAMLTRMNSDQRARGNFLYMATHTHRFAGQGIQLQNMQRPTGEYDLKLGLRALVEGWGARVIDLMIGPPLAVVGQCMRNMIRAAPDHELISADLSNIEGRVNAWLGGEEWKLQAFRDYDTIIDRTPTGKPIRKGPDLYLVAAAGIYGCAPSDFTEDSIERQHGKVSELACGYQGALGAFKKMAKNYGVRLPDKKILEIVARWRQQNDGIRESWTDMQEAAFEAVDHPGERVDCCGGKISFVVFGPFLWARMPSGGLLAYCRPEIREVTREINRLDEEGNYVLDGAGEPIKDKITRPAVTFWGVNSQSRRWQRTAGYGGYWCENFVQKMSRDVFVEAMLRIEDCNYPIVLHSHDEAVSEVPRGFGSVSEYESLMAKPVPWLPGCPISSKGWRGDRYKK